LILYEGEENMYYEELIIRAKEGDKMALEELMMKYKGLIIKHGNSVYINGYDKEDLIQIGYMSVMNAVNKYDFQKGNFTAYVSFAIQKNFNYLIRGKARENYVSSLDYYIEDEVQLVDIIKSEENIEGEYIKKEIKKIVQQCINELPVELRDIIDYHYIKNEGTLKKYSEEKNINYRIVTKRKGQAIRLLKNALNHRNITY